MASLRQTPPMKILISALLLAVIGCGGSPGKIVGAKPNVSFVKDTDALYYFGPGRKLKWIRIDGSDGREVFVDRYSVLDVSDDGQVFVLGDSDTNIYIGDPQSGKTRRISAFDKRAGALALSGDGRRLALVKHSDFDRAQSQNSDAIYVVDLSDLTYRTITGNTKQIVTNLWWSLDAQHLYARGHENSQIIDMSNGTRSMIAEIPDNGLRRRGNLPPSTSCKRSGKSIKLLGYGGDDGLEIVDKGGVGTTKLTITGRKRGGHDYLDTIATAGFSPSCEYVVFTFGGSLWVLDVTTSMVGRLIEGSTPFLDPSEHAPD